MARSTEHRPHGTRGRYQNGCICPDCVAAGDTEKCSCDACSTDNRLYARRNKRLKALNGGIPVEHPPARAPGLRVETKTAELVETKVQEELDLLGEAATAKPGLAAAAKAMGRLLDDPTSGPQHPAAVGQLRAALKEIRGTAAAKPKSRLESIRGGRGA